LCHHIQQLGTSIGFSPKVRLWFVDLHTKDTTRFFRSRAQRGLIDSMMFLGDDYREWLGKPRPLPATNDLRVALVSKLFNNLSRFCVRRVSPEEKAFVLNRKGLASDAGQHSPSRCLGPDGPGAEALGVSPTPVALSHGRAIAQLSLSEFYEGLCALLSPKGFVGLQDNGLFLPVRTFNPECLRTSGGSSVVAHLVETCDYVLIEDGDLSPNDLADHMRRFALHSIAAYDLSKALGLVSNYAYILWDKSKVEPPETQGERLW
jgi:hypothetical protein